MNLKTIQKYILAIFLAVLSIQLSTAQVMYYSIGDGVNSKKEYIEALHVENNTINSLSLKWSTYKVLNNRQVVSCKLKSFTINQDNINKYKPKTLFEFKRDEAGTHLLSVNDVNFQISGLFFDHTELLEFDRSGNLLKDLKFENEKLRMQTSYGVSSSGLVILAGKNENEILSINEADEINTVYTFEDSRLFKHARLNGDDLTSYTTYIDSTSLQLKLFTLNTNTGIKNESFLNAIDRIENTSTDGFSKRGQYYLLTESDSTNTYVRLFSMKNDSIMQEFKSITYPTTRTLAPIGVVNDIFVFRQRIFNKEGYKILEENILLLRDKDDIEKYRKGENLFPLIYEGVKKSYLIRVEERLYILTDYSKKSKKPDLKLIEYRNE